MTIATALQKEKYLQSTSSYVNHCLNQQSIKSITLLKTAFSSRHVSFHDKNYNENNVDDDDDDDKMAESKLCGWKRKNGGGDVDDDDDDVNDGDDDGDGDRGGIETNLNWNNNNNKIIINLGSSDSGSRIDFLKDFMLTRFSSIESNCNFDLNNDFKNKCNNVFTIEELIKKP